MSGQNSYTSNKFWYPKEYFLIQIHFARKLSNITRTAFEKVLLDNTGLYWRVIGEDYKKSGVSRKWDDLVDSKLDDNDLADLLFKQFANQDYAVFKPKKSEFGFFSYYFNEQKKYVKLHFEVASRGNKSGLAAEFMNERINELKRMFQNISEIHPDAKSALGVSWLLNIDACTRLFPKEFKRSSKRIPVKEWNLHGDEVWGQFLDSKGYIKKDLMETFINAIDKFSTIEELFNAFPFPPLLAKCDIDAFYNFYGVKRLL